MLYTIENLLKRRQRGQGCRLLIKSLHIRRGARIAPTWPGDRGSSTTPDLHGMALRPDSATHLTFSPKPEAPPLDVAALRAGDRPDARDILKGIPPEQHYRALSL